MTSLDELIQNLEFARAGLKVMKNYHDDHGPLVDANALGFALNIMKAAQVRLEALRAELEDENKELEE